MDVNQLAVDTYNKIAPNFSDRYFSDTTDIPFLDEFLKLLPKEAKILDIGCGPGQFSKYMSEQGFKVEGIDKAEEMINIAQTKTSQTSFKVMDMRKLEYGDNSFGGVWASYVLIHLPNEQILPTLAEWKRVLKDEGIIAIAAQAGQPEQIVDEPLAPGEKMFMNFFDKETIADYLKKTGFQILSLKQDKVDDPECLSDEIIYLIARKEKAVKK